MGKYECIDFSKKLKSNFFVEYIKHSSEYKDVLNRIVALDYNDDIDFWIKRDNYSLFVRLFDFDTLKKEFQIQFIVFISLNLFCENKNIYLPDLEYPIIIIETDCNNKICKNLKIYGKIMARKGIFNNFYFDRVSCYGYFLELEDDMIHFSFINLVSKFDTLNKMHYLNMFLNCTINNIKNVYISDMNTSKELDLIQLNNIKVNSIDLRVTKWFNNIYLDKDSLNKSLVCLDEIDIKVDNCYLSIIGCVDLASGLDEYQENCIKIVNNLNNFTKANTLQVTFIPSILYAQEKLELIKDKLIKMSTEKLLINVVLHNI